MVDEETAAFCFLFVETAVQYCREAEALYYSMLEAIITEERKRLVDKDLSVSLLPSAVHNCIFRTPIDLTLSTDRISTNIHWGAMLVHVMK